MTQEILPPDGFDVLGADHELVHLDLPEYADWTKAELGHAHWFNEKYRTGARYFVECGEILAPGQDGAAAWPLHALGRRVAARRSANRAETHPDFR